MSAFGVIARVFTAMLAVAAGAVAWRAGGGAEVPPPPPRAASTVDAAAPSGAPGSGGADAEPGETYEVAARLVELAKQARFDVPRADAAKGVLRAHWRQQRPPYVPLSGDAARFVSVVALRTSATETQWSQPVGKEGKAWAPAARVWNMNEGSFDQRESLLAPAPATIAFRLSVPRGARFTFSEATMNATEETTVFTVTVVDSKGASKEVHRHALAPSASRKWTEASCDLSAYAGQEVELRLATESTRPREPVKKKKPARPREPTVSASASSGPADATPALDGGAVRDDALAAPGPPVALWGNPTILSRTTPRVPYNVLWIVVDALRPDVIASFHDDAEDAKKQAAPLPPLEALLPKVPGLTPEIDELTRRGVRFTHAYSAGSWTRPGTLAMLSGLRSSELGIDTTAWMLSPAEVNRFYSSDPPLLSLVLRRHAVTTRAFVNNYFMVGYVPIGVDMGFERVDDHRYRTRDTLEITEDAARWIKENNDTRFFAFVNYNSPHEPYEPPPRLLDRVPPPPVGPKDRIARLYMAEAAKDDEAIGVLMRTLDEAGLRDRTIVVVTADHGETMSSAHSGTSGLDKMPLRYHHAVGNFEETTKVPILIVAPGQLPSGGEVKARVRSTDIAPTLLELLGLEPHPRMNGKSLVPLAKGQVESEERVVVSEGRGSRAIMHGRFRLIAREGAARIVMHGDRTRETDFELYDLIDDPGERRDLAGKKPEIVAEMKARLDAALKNVPVPGAAAPAAAASGAGASAPADAQGPTLHLRFVGGPQPRRVTGTITIGGATVAARRYDVEPVELGRDSFRSDGGRVDIAFRTSPSAPVGFDIVVDPPATPVTWELWLDDKLWPEEATFGGPFGLLSPALRKGVASDEARAAAHARALPMIDPQRDVGLFVVRERRGEADGPRVATAEGAEEMARLLEEWGYARGSSAKK